MNSEEDSYRFLRMPEVERLIGLKRSSIYNRVREGSFPKPIPLGPKVVAWRSDVLKAWMDQQSASAGAGA